jgi:hypothetical protein
LSEKNKQYRDENKEKIDTHNKEKIPCETCGSMVTRKHIARHKKSNKCLSSSSNSPVSIVDSDTLVGEDREFGGNLLYIDMIPSSSWYNNVRQLVKRSSWDKIRKKVYERANYKCECCGYNCKYRGIYPNEDFERNEITTYNTNFNPDIELRKWNRVQLEAHERWSYDVDNKIQKLERIVALCHRCHSATHMGLAGLRGVHIYAKSHINKVNEWNEEEYDKHLICQNLLYRKRSSIEWKLNLDIITNSGYKLEETFS